MLRKTSFDTQKFHVLPTQHIYVLGTYLRRNSSYLPTQH
jgi:hypothetical protein